MAARSGVTSEIQNHIASKSRLGVAWKSEVVIWMSRCAPAAHRSACAAASPCGCSGVGGRCRGPSSASRTSSDLSSCCATLSKKGWEISRMNPGLEALSAPSTSISSCQAASASSSSDSLSGDRTRMTPSSSNSATSSGDKGAGLLPPRSQAARCRGRAATIWQRAAPPDDPPAQISLCLQKQAREKKEDGRKKTEEERWRRIVVSR